MREIIKSDKTIKTKDFGKAVTVNTDPGSSSSFLLENFGEEMMNKLEIIDEPEKFRIEVSFLQANGTKETCIFKKGPDGGIAIFDQNKYKRGEYNENEKR